MQLITGSLIEVKWGHLMADFYIYNSVFFLLTIFLINLSLFISMMKRPFIKRFYGFYLIHIGLIILSLGGILTKEFSREGVVNLFPNLTTRTVVEEKFEVNVSNKKMDIALMALPNTVLKKDISFNEIIGIKFLKYLPFSKEVKLEVESLGDYFYEVELFNSTIFEKKQFTSNPNSAYRLESKEVGKLDIFTTDVELSSCLKISEIILIDKKSKTCLPFNSKMERIIKIPYKSGTLTFAPSFSRFPLSQKGVEILDSQYLILSTIEMKKNNTIVIGKNLTYYFTDKLTTKRENLIELPWMDLKLKINRIFDKTIVRNYQASQAYDRYSPAVKFEHKNSPYWIDLNNSALVEGMLIKLNRKTFNLPFEITLLKFIKDTDFGTQSDSFYKTVLNLRNENGATKKEIYLNNPLKEGEITLFQDSYKALEKGRFRSDIRVNTDPGRHFKYVGWVISIMGMLIHFRLRGLKL
jgi:hypothetical protein